jgi:hypothetical protein
MCFGLTTPGLHLLLWPAEVGQVVLKKKTAARPSLQQVQNNFQTLGLNHGTGSGAS